ncbi:MAG: aldo/keto reductase, partial [Actinomycetes bacterium]
LKHPTVLAVAERQGRTPAQVIIRWHLQHGVVVIPKSGQEERIRSNAQVGDLELTDEDMAELDGIARR